MKLAVVIAAVLGGGCQTLIYDSFLSNDFSGDEFPIDVDLSSGAVMLGMQEDVDAPRIAVLDVLAPYTQIDHGADKTPTLATAPLLTLLDANGLARAGFDDALIVADHPCSQENSMEVPCSVGSSANPVTFSGIIGAEALAGDAIRFRLADSQIFVLPDVAGSEESRSIACDGVYGGPFHGGGTQIIGNSDVDLDFGGRRIAISTCLGPDPSPTTTQAFRGSDALFVMSTAIGPSLIGESAYRHYVEAHPCATPSPDCPVPFEQLPDTDIYLPSGNVTGKAATLPSLALVASTSSTARGACRQVFANHFMTKRDCVDGDLFPGFDDCPCDNGDTFCSAPAITEVTPSGGLPFVVIPDDNGTLQALRAELRPDQPEVDGILGTSAMMTTEIDADYPHNRLLTRCWSDTGCVVRPRITATVDRNRVQHCIRGRDQGPDFPLP
ncbi:MAG TPA: hypothetical protein VGM90_08340 [Kofleriaceae bacterium]|jgi:hypothetical protein